MTDNDMKSFLMVSNHDEIFNAYLPIFQVCEIMNFMQYKARKKKNHVSYALLHHDTSILSILYTMRLFLMMGNVLLSENEKKNKSSQYKKKQLYINTNLTISCYNAVHDDWIVVKQLCLAHTMANQNYFSSKHMLAKKRRIYFLIIISKTLVSMDLMITMLGRKRSEEA